MKIGKSPWCCPRQAEFWRLCRTSWCATCWKLVRLPGVAPGHAPWRGAILLLNHNREIKRAGSCVGLWPSARTSRPAPFQQRTNTSCYLAIPTHGFTVALSVFRGTPPPKPLKCKIRFTLSGDAMDRSWAHHIGDQPMLVLAKINLSPEDITWMSRYSCSQIVRLSLIPIFSVSSAGKIKNPAYTR